MWRRRGCGGKMSGGSGEEWEGMLGLVWGIDEILFCCMGDVVWFVGAAGKRCGGGY